MNRELARKLEAMARDDQEYRKRWFDHGHEKEYQDGRDKLVGQHRVSLEKIIAEHGWPSARLVGRAASHAAWLLVQHSSLELQKQSLDLMKPLSPEENDMRQMAYLTDKIRIREDKPQVYGTQYCRKEDGIVLCDVEVPETLNERRKSVGLPSARYVYDMDRARQEEEAGTAFSSLGGWRTKV